MLHYSLRERLWSSNIGQIEFGEDGKTNIFEGEHSGVHFITFPKTPEMTILEKQAVLANLTCRTVLVYFRRLISMMFKRKLFRTRSFKMLWIINIDS